MNPPLLIAWVWQPVGSPLHIIGGAAVLSGLLPRSLADVLDQLQTYGFIILIGLLYLGIPSMLYSPVINFVLSYLFAS